MVQETLEGTGRTEIMGLTLTVTLEMFTQTLAVLEDISAHFWKCECFCPVFIFSENIKFYRI